MLVSFSGRSFRILMKGERETQVTGHEARGTAGRRKKKREATVPQEFWNFRKEIIIEDGMLLKLDRIIIPTNLISK